LRRVQALDLYQLAKFYNFQKHGRNGIPKVLQVEAPTPPAAQIIETQSAKTGSSSGQDAQEHLEKTKVSIHVEEIMLTNPEGDEAKAQVESSIKKG